MRKGAVAFANFICTFGDAGGLVDNWDIVGPAFFTDTLVRRYGKNSFHLYDVQMRLLDEGDGVPVLGVCGRFVKNTILSREQTIDDVGALVKSPAEIASSPSAFFILVLNTHRLVYFAETAHAPDLKSFESTMADFIKRFRERKINAQHKEANGTITKKALRERLPRPTVTVVPLSEREKLSDFIDRFSKVRVVKFRLIKPNHESDASEIVSAVRERLGPLQPDYLDITASSREGLDKPEVKQAVEEASETGNTGISLRGEGIDGEVLSGSAEQFALSSEIDTPATSDEGLSTQLYVRYRDFVRSKKITVGEQLGGVADKIRSLAALL